MRPIYLDYNATTPIAPEVLAAMQPYLAEHFGNPSSGHRLGRHCQQAVEAARGQVAELLGAQHDEIVFTSGGTESNNLALKGLALAPPLERQRHLVISAIEHPAIIEPARYLERCGVEVSVVGVDSQGRVDPDEVAAALRDHTLLVSIMHANNEVGTLQPIAEIARRCRERGVLMHTDAAQSVGKVPVRVDELGVDMLTMAGHKLYAPKGVGVLYVRRGVKLEPLLHGAAHESGRRAGTENVPYLVALGVAARLASESLPAITEQMRQLRDRLWERLRAEIGGQLTMNAAEAPRLPNTLSVNFPGVSGNELLAAAPQVCASTGAACHSGATQRSATQAAMGIEPGVARGTLRLSVGRFTTIEQVDEAAAALVAAWRKCR